jgi:hypothetical protein
MRRAVVCVPLFLMVSMGLAQADKPAAPARPGKPAAASRPGLGGKRVVKQGDAARAWSVLRPLLPDRVQIAGQIHVGALRGSDLWKAMKKAAEKDRNASGGFDAIKQGCGIDASEAVQDVAFAADKNGRGQVVFALSVKNVSEADALRCVEAKLSHDHGGQPVKVEAKKLGTGPIVEYGVIGEAEKLYVAWLAPDVIAVGSDPSDRALLEGMLGGKGGFAGLPAARKAIGSVGTSALAWGVYAAGESLGAYEMKYANGTLTLASGQLALDVAVVLADADQAKRAAADWTAEVSQMASSGVPGVVSMLIKNITITATDDTVHVAVSAAEKDLVALFSLF